ncbi:MAG: phage tail family protein [Bacteroidales bacterium]|nr:phage tail family protein [Bacteroidales bacterium]
MRSRYEAILNGVSLSSISSDILILDVSYPSPAFRDTTFTVANRHGVRHDKRKFEPLTASISFEIHAYDIRRRQAIRDAVCEWARNGGKLEINDHHDQFIQCVCSQFPSVGSVRNWTDSMAVEFTAYEVPFWQEKNPVVVSLTGQTASKAVYVPGTGEESLVEVEITPSQTLTSITLNVNDRELTLSGISVSANSTIVISYDDRAIQSIKNGNTSLLNKRTGVDDLLAVCGGNNQFSVSANKSVNATFKVRGLWT